MYQFNELSSMLHRCENLYDIDAKTIAKLPRGTLHVKRCGAYLLFYRSFRGKEYGIKRRPEVLEGLLRKKVFTARASYYDKLSVELKKLIKEVEAAKAELEKPVLSEEVFAATGIDRDAIYYTPEALAWM